MSNSERAAPKLFRGLGIVGCLLLIATLVPSDAPAGAPLVLVAHSDVPEDQLSREDIEKIFLGKRLEWEDGKKIVVIEQKSNRALRRRFAEDYLGRTLRAIESHWRRQIFTGRGVPPRQLSNEAAVVEFVRNTPGAISYLRFDPGGVKHLQIRD